jgi:hypothetical protein
MRDRKLKQQPTLEQQADRLLMDYAKSSHTTLASMGVLSPNRQARIAKYEIAMSDYIAESIERSK